MPNKFVNKFCYILSICFLLFSTKHKNGHLFATKIESKKIAMLSGQKLDFHMRQFSFANLLKAKAENTLPLVPEKERILFRQCADGANADDERELARCFLALFRARDEQKRRKMEGKMEGKIEGENIDEALSENPVARFIRTTLAMFWPPILGCLEKQWNWWSKGNNQMANGHSEASENNIGRRNGSEEAAEAQIEIKWKLIMKRKANGNAVVKNENNEQKKMMRRRRRRRKINDDQLPPSMPSNIEKLKMIRRFFKAFNEYRRRIERYNEHRNAIQKAFPHLFTRTTNHNVNGKNAKSNADASNANSASFSFEESENISIFSPKLFSLFPSDNNDENAPLNGERRKNAEIIREIFSPNLLSFYEEKEEGGGKRNNNGSKIGQNGKFGGQIASIPQLLRLIISNRKNEDKWLNFLIQITGTGRILEKLHSQIRRFEQVLRERIMPLAMELEGMALGMAKLEGTMGRKQKEYFKKNGYTFLSSGQMKLLANEGPGKRKMSPRMEKINKRPKGIKDAQFPVIAEMMEEHMEDYIQEIGQMPLANEKGENQQKQPPIEHAQIVQRIRRKRQLPISGPVVGILAPFAFQPQVNSLQLFTLYVLSPQAFIPSYFNPAMFYVQLLTPWAFLANLFSPQAFTCLCLSPVMIEANAFSPQFFYLELLSPTIMQANMLSPYFFLATILSPQIMIADLLTPNFFQYKIFSPQHFMAGLLSPSIGSPNIYSEQSHLFAVLSPNIASPNVYSKVSNSVFIFSPEILGGHGGERGYEEEGENVVTIPDEDHPTQGAGKFGIVHTHG